MKLYSVFLAAAMTGGAGLAFAADSPPAAQAEPPLGSQLFDRYCVSCHPKSDPPRPGEQPKAEEMRDLPPDQMKMPDAPPMPMTVAIHRASAGTDKAKFVAHIVTFLRTPTAETALDQRAVQQFGLKKPIAEKHPEATDAELTTIAEWMWETFQPATQQAPVAQQAQQTPPAQAPQQGQAAGQAPAPQGQQSAAMPQPQGMPPGQGGGQPGGTPEGMQQGSRQGMAQGSLPAPDSPLAKAEGAKLFAKFCGACHPKSDSPDAGETPLLPPDQMKIEAPPMSMMAAHYRQVVGGDKSKFITRLVDFNRNPSEDKAVDPRAIKQFGVKKPIAEKFPHVTDADMAVIAEWMWEYYKDAFVIRLPAHGVWGR